jgi:small subunit ribosomal protein S16
VAVTLRLARLGQKKRPYYRIVAIDKENRRNGRFIEIVGTHNPMTDPPTTTIKEDKIRKWISVGAETSSIVKDIIVKNIPGLIEERTETQRKKIQALRKKRKERSKAKTK